STSLGMSAVSVVNYSWSPVTGLNSSTVSNPVASPSATTTYILTAIQSSSGIFNKDTVLVTVTPAGPTPPTVNVTQPTCTSSATITVTSSISGLSFSIDSLDYSNTSGIFSSVAPGTYNLRAKNSSGCVSNPASVTV